MINFLKNYFNTKNKIKDFTKIDALFEKKKFLTNYLK